MNEYHPESERYPYMGIGDAGVFARKGNSSITIYDNRLICYVGELEEGGIVLDKRSCLEKDLIKGTCSGPILDINLDKSTLNNTNHELVNCNNLEGLNNISFAYVSLDLYIQYWYSLGACVGFRKENKILWSDGRVWEIPSPEERYMVNGVIRSKETEWAELTK